MYRSVILPVVDCKKLALSPCGKDIDCGCVRRVCRGGGFNIRDWRLELRNKVHYSANFYASLNIIRVRTSRRVRWTGSVARMRMIRNAYTF